jgi:hypothetical protein
MMAKSVVALAAMGALLTIDLNYMVAFAHSYILAKSTMIELAVFWLQFAKTIMVLVVKRLRHAGQALLVDIYGAELLLIPAVLLSAFFVGPRAVGSFLSQLIGGWIVGVLFFGLPFVAYRLRGSIAGSGSLPTLLPSGIVAAELSVMLANASGRAAGSQVGLSDLLTMAAQNNGLGVPENLTVFAALCVLYASLLVYAVLGLGSGYAVDRNRALVVGTLATGSSLVWFLLFSTFSLGDIVVYSFPTFVIAGTVWWYAHAG